MKISATLGVLAMGLTAFAAVPACAGPAPAPELAGLPSPGADYRVDRMVILYRHGLRAPLDSEIGAKEYSSDPWPVWSTANAQLTPHGRAALRLMGGYDRAWFTALGLFGAAGCPGADTLDIYTDSDDRSIGSGHELREGLAPGCQIQTRHKPLDVPDLAFTAGAPGAAPFDAKAAVASINRYTNGSPATLVEQTRPETRVLETILGCRDTAKTDGQCDIAAVPTDLHADDSGIQFSGPIMITSGTAEVLLLQYAEGMPMSQVGWGRADPAKLAEVSRLHALLFDVFDRSPYMARRTATEMAPRIRDLLTGGEAPKVTLFVGHDNNIAALTSLLGASFHIPSYGRDDPPIGGGLGFELLTNTKTGKRFVRVFYQAQTLDQMRDLSPLSLASPPAMQVLSPTCAKGPAKLCPLDELADLFTWPGQAQVPAADSGEAE